MLKQIPRLPRGAARGKKPIIDTEISRDTPRENETDSESEKYRIDAYRASEEVVEIHKESEECRDAGKCADDESDADEKFAVGDDI